MAIISNNAGGMMGGIQAPVNPNYLGSAYDFSGSTVPGFYNINPATFPFYAMRNQVNNGLYTPGQPNYVPFNQNNPSAPAGIRMPSGQSLYSITANPNGWPNDPLSQAMFNRRAAAPVASNYATPQLYNQAMRQYAAQQAAGGNPLMVYYDPRYSNPQRQVVSNNARGLLTT